MFANWYAELIFLLFDYFYAGEWRWGEAWNDVQAASLNLILGRMYHRCACRILAQDTHNILWCAFGESIELCVWHRSVNYAAGAIGKRCNFISMILQYDVMRHITLLTDDLDHFYQPSSTRCDLHRQIHWSTLCAWYVQHSQKFHTPVQYICN